MSSIKHKTNSTEELVVEENEPKLLTLEQFSDEYFLHKHSPSFRCFEQFLCSQSDLRITLSFFPPLQDPGLDNALYFTPPDEEPQLNGADKYIKMCTNLSIVPIKRVIKSLNTDTLNLKYYGISYGQMRGISDALKVNTNIKNVIFEDNFIEPASTALISEILCESKSIRYLNLRLCHIGEEGAAKLAEGIAASQFLQELDLSYNSLGDSGMQHLQNSLIENTSIKTVNLSHNKLTEKCGSIFERVFNENKVLERVDLSWNGFYTGPGNKKLFKGLMFNETIKWLSFAWNGIGTDAAMRPLTKFLKTSETLQFLDLSWNRITQSALRMLRGALIRNKSLKQVKLGHNIYTPDEAYFLAQLFTRAKNELTHLDMEDMCVNKNFLQLKNQQRKKGKLINHGHVLNNYTIHGPNVKKLLFERCRYLAMKPKKKKKKVDFGHFVLSLPDQAITNQEFYDLLKKKKVKTIFKDKDLVNELVNKFVTKSKKLDCNSLKEAFMGLYPHTVLPPKKKKKQKKKKKRKKNK